MPSAPTQIRFKAVQVSQGDMPLYAFAAPARTLFGILEINERDSDKDEGYQRALSTSRVRAISTFVDDGNAIAPAIVVSLHDAEFDQAADEILVPNRPDAGWVIDGQHRLAGAAKAQREIQLTVVAFLQLSLESQIFQFVTINRTAKGVPTSLYFDLLRALPPSRSPAEVAREKAVDIANELKKDEGSALFNRITVSPPRPGHTISLTNFVRKITPLIQEARSTLSVYSLYEQTRIVDNYFRGLRACEPGLFAHRASVVFRTVGFGALMNALPTFFNVTLMQHGGFTVEDVSSVFQRVAFRFSEWENAGSGNAAELQAGRDLEETVRYVYESNTATGSSVIRL